MKSYSDWIIIAFVLWILMRGEGGTYATYATHINWHVTIANTFGKIFSGGKKKSSGGGGAMGEITSLYGGGSGSGGGGGVSTSMMETAAVAAMA